MFTHFVARAVRDCSARQKPFGNLRPLDPAETKFHLRAAIGWLERSIDACNGRGSSKGFAFLKGWLPAYPETSGYIIPTLLTIARMGGGEEYRTKAGAIARWLCSIQRSDGGFLAREIGASTEPDVFDSGMILLGFNALLFEEQQDAIRRAAEKTANFLVSSLDHEGCFVRHLSHGIAHAYNVRSAWALVAHGMLAGDQRFIDAGRANADWTLAQKNGAGFFDKNAFKPGANANLHGVAYVMQGLVEIGVLIGEQKYWESVFPAARALMASMKAQGWIAAELGPKWQFLSGHICLTGYAQLALVCFRLFDLTGDPDFREAGEQLITGVALRQQLSSTREAPEYGAIPGSFPIYGRYAPLQYPNWATKFFIDALLAKQRLARGRPSIDPLQGFGA